MEFPRNGEHHGRASAVIRIVFRIFILPTVMVASGPGCPSKLTPRFLRVARDPGIAGESGRENDFSAWGYAPGLRAAIART
jgi:hypothetical protein